MANRSLYFILLFFILFTVLLPFASADIMNITNAAYVRKDTASTNYGSSEYIYKMGSGWSYEEWAYIQIPEHIGTVYLNLYVVSVEDPTINIYNTTSFDESGITWNNRPSAVSAVLLNYVHGDPGAYTNITLGGVSNYIIINGSLSYMEGRYCSDDIGITCTSGKQLYVSYTPPPPPLNETRINISSNVDYNTTISTSNINSSFYVTTWISNELWNSDWSWWSYIVSHEFYLEYVDPHGTVHDVSPVYAIYNQNASQKLVNLSSIGVFGDYTFRIKRYFNDTALAQSSITLTNDQSNTNNPTYDFHFVSNNSNDPNILAIHTNPEYVKLSFDYYNYNTTYGENWAIYSGYSNDLGNVEAYGNGTYNMATTLLGLVAKPILIRGRMCTSYNYGGCVSGYVGTDYVYYNPFNTTPTPTPTPTIPPTPYPTFTSIPTSTPIPTPATTYTPQPTITFTPQPTSTNYSNYNGSGMGNLNDFGNLSGSAISNINNGSANINSQIQSYDYSKSKSIYSYILPSIFNMIPPKIWGIIILGWALEISLILLKR